MDDLTGLRKGYYYIDNGVKHYIYGVIRGDYCFEIDPKHLPEKWCLNCDRTWDKHICKDGVYKWGIRVG